jgi:hypothetical protein
MRYNAYRVTLFTIVGILNNVKKGLQVLRKFAGALPNSLGAKEGALDPLIFGARGVLEGVLVGNTEGLADSEGVGRAEGGMIHSGWTHSVQAPAESHWNHQSAGTYPPLHVTCRYPAPSSTSNILLSSSDSG